MLVIGCQGSGETLNTSPTNHIETAELHLIDTENECKGGRTSTASRHETKDAVLLHSWFRHESAHRSSTCLRLITSSLVDDMTSSSEEDILMSITYTGAVPWVLMSESWCTEKEHAESCCTCLQHEADVSIMTQTGVRRFSESHSFQLCSFLCVMSQTSCLDCYMSWRMPVCGLAKIIRISYLVN
jgi:hypothetical protein